MKAYHYIFIILAFSIFMFTFGLGNMPLTDPDESFYAATAQEMTEDGEWITPTIFGKPQFEKPILYYWLIRISYEVFGVNEFSSRLPSAVFGVLGVLGIFYLGKLLFSPLCGFLSALVTMTNIQYIVFARACVTDMVLAVFILYSILFALLGWTGKRKIYFYLSSVMAGLAVLTKGPIALFIIGATIILYLIVSKQLKRLKEVPVVFSFLILMAVIMPWYLLVYKINGQAFLSEFFGLHNVTRFLTPEHKIGDTPFFYIPIIFGGFAPWSIFLPFAAWHMFRSERKESRIKAYKPFLLVWFMVTFMFFSVSRTKLVTYIFPLFPVLSIVVGRFWEIFLIDSIERNALKKQMKVAYMTLFIGTLLGMAGGFLALKYKGYTEVFIPALVCGIVFLSGLSGALFLFFKKKYTHSFAAVNITFLVLVIPLVYLVLPIVGNYESSKEISAKLDEQMGTGELLGGVCDQRRGLAFYTGRREIVNIQMDHDKVNFLNNEDRVWGVVNNKHYDQLRNVDSMNLPVTVYAHGNKVLFTNKSFEK